MTLTEINALTIDDFYYQLSTRLINGIQPNEIQIIDKTFDGCIISSNYVKPTLAEYESEFLVLKQELIDAENARLAEVARREAMQLRIDKLVDYHIISSNIGKHQANEKVEYKRIIDENDIITLEELEAENAIHVIKKAKKESREIQKRLGNKRDQACKDCLAIIRGENLGKTKTEIDAMKLAFSEIYTRLSDGSPELARLAIEAIPNDGVVDLLKADLLDELLEHGF